MDFIFIVRETHLEKNKTNLIEKEWYTGYIGFLNVTLINSTHKMLNIYDKSLLEILKKNNLRSLENIDDDIIDENKLCFSKIKFYKNGDIKKYYIPKEFSKINFKYIEETAKLIIPKISKNLYVSNINEKLDELTSNLTEENNDEISQPNDFNSYRNLNYENLIINTKINKTISNKRLLQTTNLFNNVNFTETSEDIYIDNYLKTPSTKSINFDLREVNKLNESSNNSNLTEFSIKSIECDEAKMEGGMTNTTTFSFINEDGFLESIVEKTISLMKMNNKEESEEEDEDEDEDTQILNSEVYNEKNEITLDDIKNQTSVNNNFSFGIDNLTTFSSLILNCTDNFTNEKINQKIYKYFDSFDYIEYNKSEDEKEFSRILEENNLKNKDNRRLEEDNSYYGVKNFLYVKQLYKYNLIGLKMESQIFVENDPSTGKFNAYQVIIFGNKNTKIKMSEQQSNSHIILEKKNQMGYNLLLLLHKSNEDLMERNKNYADIILNLENNITSFFNESYDYSNLLRESLNNLYDTVKDFSGEFFYELIKLINKVYSNYTIILQNIKLEKYDVFNEIRKITKEEYINYIYNMIDILEKFENNTMTFLENIELELNNVYEFQIDILYDIIDQIYESKLIFLQFNKNLFKSIEKGILTLRYDLRDYIEEIIGDLLYITDFLAININKNEILIKAIDLNTRTDTTIKLKDFRNIILIIMDILMNNINNDYEMEMNLNNNNSIKYYSYQKAEEFLNNTQEKSDKVTKDIKSRINDIEIYELFSKNLDIIDNIHNKTNLEYMDEMYKNIIYKSMNLKPEYINEENNISQNKKKLFNLSKNIVNEINIEINEINTFIFNYTKKYIEENIYNIYYNLYYFRKSFLDEQMEELLNEFYLLVNRTIKIHFKKMIDYNFNLSNEVFDEENHYFNKYRGESRRMLCKGFIKRFYEYETKFEIYLSLTYSEDFLNLLEKYFYKLRDDILFYVRNKIFSVKKYYFDIDLYKREFYFHEQSDNEILKIIDNINNYYNEINLNGGIKLKAFHLSQEILTPYHKKKIKELEKYYKYLYSRTTNYVKDSSKDFVYSYWRYLLKGWKNTYLKVPHTNNIKLVLKNLDKTDKYLLNEINKIFNHFISKIDVYLSNYAAYYQKLYFNLYQFVETKIYNSRINSLLNKYQNTINENVNIDSNNGLLQRLNNETKIIGININNYLRNLEGNINLLENEYFALYYSKDYEKFLEYPNEIIFKIKQFFDELKDNCDNIKKMINNIYKRKIFNIIKSTNKFVSNYIQEHFNFIISNINSNIIMKEYSTFKYSELNITFTKCINLINSLSDEFVSKENNIADENGLFLNLRNYNEPMENITNTIKIFLSYLEDIIKKDFISKNCQMTDTIISNNSEKDMSISSDIFCIEEEKKFDSQRYSKYNYNIVKLRTGIYYTKKLMENIYSLFDEFNFQNLININKIISYDELLNDNNIFHIYNETNYILSQINKESILTLEEVLENFYEDFEEQYTYKNDYLPFFEKFKKIITFQNNYFNGNITYIINDTLRFSISFLNEFNETLFKQISLISNYDYYNFNQTYFKKMYTFYKSLLDECFKDYKNAISNLKYNYIFHNSFKKFLRKLQQEKRKYFKEQINYYAQNYDFNLLNMTIDLGESESIILKRKYDDYEFIFIYDYIELFEKYTDNFINTILPKITVLEKKIKEKLENIYNNFYSIYSQNISSFVDINYIDELNYKHLICLKYSYDKLLNNNNESDNINNEIYNNIYSLINLTFSNCIHNKINVEKIDKIPLIDKINFINNSSGCIDFLKYENYIDSNELMELLDCYNNNFYNLSVFYFQNFNQTYKEALDNSINNISIKIKNSYIDGNFLYNFLEKTYQLEPYNISLSDILYNYEDIENMINYINSIKNDIYKNHLYDLFVESFNNSYFALVNNYLVDELIDDISILIIDKLDLNIEYMTKKIKNEFNYYLLLLNTTEELGYSSKNAFINLYKYMKTKLNETLFYLIEDDIYFYLNIFYRENKNLFRERFINYYNNNLNKYEITIFKLPMFIDEIILDRRFNKTLDLISKEIIQNIIIKSIKDKINESIEIKLDKLYNMLELFAIDIKNILDKKETKILPEDMQIINELIINYTDLVNKQNNHYLLKISEKPFNILYYFIHNNLEPPLLLIKEQYNSIEERLLNEIIKIINNFPDVLPIIEDKLNLELILNNISITNEYIKELFIEYKDILNEDFLSYINKLIHFTYINGLYTYDYPCNYSFCLIDIKPKKSTNNNKTNGARRLEHNDIKYIFNFPKINKREVNILTNKKVRKLEGYDHTMGAITKNDVISFLLDIESTLYNFNKSYLGKEFKNINKTSSKYFNKVNDTYLNKLKRNIEMVALKFSTILTKNNYKILENNIYYQYNNILSYINSFSDSIENQKNNFVNYLNFSSTFLEVIYNLSYNSVYGNYQIFCTHIENKQKYISEKELKEYLKRKLTKKKEEGEEEEDDDPEGPPDFKNAARENEIEKFYKDLFGESQEKAQNDIQNYNENQQSKWEKISKNIKDFLKGLDYSSSAKMNSYFFKHINETSFGLSICKKFDTIFKKIKDKLTLNYSYPLGGFIELGVVIKPNLELGICLDFGTEINWEDKEYSFYFDIYAMAEVSISVEVGAYVPSLYSPIQISVSLGLKGVIGAGKVGFKLSLYIGEDKYACKLYFELEAFTFIFYILIKFEIQLKIISFSFEFYIYNTKFLGLIFKTHTTTIHKYKGNTLKEFSGYIGKVFAKGFNHEVQSNKTKNW